jgi:type I restriction enzyme S subunit
MNSQDRLEDISEDWGIRKVSELFKVETGTTPSTKKKDYWTNGHINWITPTDLSRLEATIRIDKSERKITESALNETSLNLLPKDSIVISTRAPVGYVAVLNERSSFNQGCKGLIPIQPNNVCSTFYCYYFIFQSNSLKKLSGGSTFKELSKESLENFRVPVPPIREQRKIAEILSTVDQAIQKVGQAIEKTVRLKKGLMQELLTKGIGHKDFKNTPIGKLPKKWCIRKLGEIAEFKNGINFRKSQRGSGGILTIDVLNMYGERLSADLKNLYRVNISFNKCSDYFLKKGDILFVRSSLKREGAGWAALFNGSKEPVIFCGFIIRARLAVQDLIPEFLVYFLRSPISRQKVISGSGQVAVTNITQETLKVLNIPVPELDEQQKIAEILSSVDKRIETLRKRKERLKKVKRGLMEDLLTGKKRVKLED